MDAKKRTLYQCALIACLCGVSMPGAYAALPEAASLVVQQEGRLVKGRVVDKDGEPILGATIVEKGNPNNGTITDMDGNFSLQVRGERSMLEFSYIGYKKAAYPVSEVEGRAIVLSEDALNLDEVVVTGYTSQKKADLTGSVSIVQVDELKSGTYGNAMKAAQGRVAGMSVSTSGNPNASATIRIRGEGTLNNNDPLYIIDGVPTTRSMSELASMDIESIQVLKDASSASIYGSRAANGVIIITTRKGKQKGTTVDFNASYTWVSKKKPYDLMNTYERGVTQYWAIKNDNPDADPNAVGIGGLYQYTDHQDANGNWVLDNVAWSEWLDSEHTMRSADTDWLGEVLRPGQIQQYNVTLTTGTDTGHAVFALDYYDNKGTIDGSFYKRFNGRINSDYTFLNGHVTIGENFTVSKWRESDNIGTNIIDATRSLMSIVPVHTVDGEGWGGPVGGMSDRQNPVRLVEDNKQNHHDNLRVFGNVYANINIIDGLTFRSSFGVDGVGSWKRTMDYTYESGFLSETRNKVTQESYFDLSCTNSNTLQYVFDVGKSNFDIMLGQETITHTYQKHWGSRRDYALENDDYMWLSSGESEKDNGSEQYRNTMVSWFGKANYNYDNRYLASVTLRRDGSSVFGANNRWGTFPAFSLGWSINNEAFFESLRPAIQLLKLRYGWGQNGNSSIDAYSSFQFYETLYDKGAIDDWNWGTAYDITGQGGTLPSGYHRTQAGNPDLKWETTSQHNFGLDFAVLDSRLSGSFDYYLKYTRDILMKPGTVATLGEGATRWLNGADIDNKGFELTLNYNDQFGDLGLNVSGVFSHNKQKIVSVPDDVINNFAGNGMDDNILGRPKNSLYGYVADGLFQSQAEVDAHAEQTGAAPGRIRYKDLNNDGVINDEDRTWIGCENPDLEYGINVGLTYKNFDLSIFFNGVIGKDLNVSGWKSWTDIYALGTAGENYGTRLLDAWTPTNTDTSIPAVSVNNYNDEGRMSTYYVESGSYLKIRNIELGYTIPRSFADKLRLQRARIALRADNVATIKKGWGDNAFTGLDPEYPGSTYPNPFSMTMSLNVTF